MKERVLFHLSHIDLDGYTCQLLTSYLFEKRNYYNSNYGREIIVRLEQIIDDIKKLPQQSKVFVLLTDLNLTIQEANFLEEIIDELLDEYSYDIELKLLDHHITGEGASETFRWYYLDSTKSATAITFEFLEKKIGFEEDLKIKLTKFTKSVNALDIWLQDEVQEFEYGKVLMKLISSARELNKLLFPKEDTKYKLQLLKDAMDIYNREDIPEDKKHIYLDDQIHFMKKRFFRRKKDDTLDNMLTDYIVNLLTKNRKNMTVTYKGYKGLLSSMIGNISLVGNGFLLKNPNYDFFIDVSGRGNVSIRANGKVDVSIMAQELGSGGGHVNASGGRIKGHRDSYLYSVILESVQSIMTEREYLETTLPNKKETKEDEKEPDNSFSNKIDLSMFKR